MFELGGKGCKDRKGGYFIFPQVLAFILVYYYPFCNCMRVQRTSGLNRNGGNPDFYGFEKLQSWKREEMNEADWRRYKEIEHITTEALWISSTGKDDLKFEIPRRELFKDWGKSFHGLFIPEIPYQFITRFAEKSGWIWDCFAGGGTTFYVAKLLNCQNRLICNDIEPRDDFTILADSRTFNPTTCSHGELIKLVFFHPPYFNIIKFSNKKEDLSNCLFLAEYLEEMEKIVRNVASFVENKGYVILVCGNIWYLGEEVDLGVMVKEIFRKYGFKCRSHIVKDYGETKGRGNTYNLQYYRNLRNDTNFFYGDNIFILRKESEMVKDEDLNKLLSSFK